MRLRERIARRLDPKVYENRDGWYRRYKELWEDHLRGCDCHDSWDQCPCVEEGHQAHQVTWRGNHCECCRWCSKPSGQPSPFAVLRSVEEETLTVPWPIDDHEDVTWPDVSGDQSVEEGKT